MLMGLEKRRKEEEDLDSRVAFRSHAGERFNDSRKCKDVEVLSSSPEYSTSTMEKVGSQEEDSSESESMFSMVFEFYKPEPAVHRPALVPSFSKPPPSKWDDAEKWISSPTSNHVGKAGGAQPKKPGLIRHGNRNPTSNVVLEVMHKVDTKRMDANLAKREVGGQKAVSWVPPVVESGAKPAHIVDDSVTDSAVSLSRHVSSQSVHSASTSITPPSSTKSVFMRDMGTEMTPLASQEPSRMGTPVGATTPTCSPTSSRPSTPGRTIPSSTTIESSDCHGDSSKNVSSEKELQMEFRREITVLGTQLGEANIAAWARKEEEETDASTSLKNAPVDQQAISVIETRAAAWEEAEKSKYMSRFKQQEIEIQAWENRQKAKSEAEMRKTEVWVERMKARGHDKLVKKLEAAKHRAEEKRAAAEGKRNQQDARTAQRAEYIRRTGRIPSSFSCLNWCS